MHHLHPTAQYSSVAAAAGISLVLLYFARPGILIVHFTAQEGRNEHVAGQKCRFDECASSLKIMLVKSLDCGLR